jgi:hypothetical protein
MSHSFPISHWYLFEVFFYRVDLFFYRVDLFEVSILMGLNHKTENLGSDL